MRRNANMAITTIGKLAVHMQQIRPARADARCEAELVGAGDSDQLCGTLVRHPSFLFRLMLTHP
jgi:hypothetical protein